MTNQSDQELQKVQQLKEVISKVKEYEQSELVNLITDLCNSSPIITNILYGMVYNEPDH